jgi:hypothetical protein
MPRNGSETAFGAGTGFENAGVPFGADDDRFGIDGDASPGSDAVSVGIG